MKPWLRLNPVGFHPAPSPGSLQSESVSRPWSWSRSNPFRVFASANWLFRWLRKLLQLEQVPRLAINLCCPDSFTFRRTDQRQGSHRHQAVVAANGSLLRESRLGASGWLSKVNDPLQKDSQKWKSSDSSGIGSPGCHSGRVASVPTDEALWLRLNPVGFHPAPSPGSLLC
jgi:hypothetical protein